MAKRDERRADAEEVIDDGQRPLRRGRHAGCLAQLLEKTVGVSTALAKLEDLVEGALNRRKGNNHAHNQAAQELRPAVMEDEEVERLGAEDGSVDADCNLSH